VAHLIITIVTAAEKLLTSSTLYISAD